MGWRNITVDGVPYIWRGSSFVIVRYGDDPRGKRACSGPVTEIKGCTWDDWERGGWKRTPDGMLRPGEVAEWIRRKVSDAPLA